MHLIDVLRAFEARIKEVASAIEEGVALNPKNGLLEIDAKIARVPYGDRAQSHHPGAKIAERTTLVAPYPRRR